METFYYAKSKLIGNPVYLLASSKGLMYLSTEVADEEQFFMTIERGFKITRAQCEYSEQQLQPVFIALSSYKMGENADMTKLKLDLRGTAFQVRVWQALVNIPYGETTYYGAIAESIDKVKAVRAVGGAIGANPILLFVPCHRVLGKNGSLTGFSAGLTLKQALLEHEAQHK